MVIIGNVVHDDGWWSYRCLNVLVGFLFRAASHNTIDTALENTLTNSSWMVGLDVLNPTTYILTNYGGWIGVTEDPGSPVDPTTGRYTSGHYYAIRRLGGRLLYLDSYLDQAVLVDENFVRNKLSTSMNCFHFTNDIIQFLRTGLGVTTPENGLAEGPSGGPSLVRPIP